MLHHRVYVILLRATPQDKGKVHVYVGMTGLTPEQRFKNHMSGNHSANIVQRRGLRLMPEIYGKIPVMKYVDAAKMEIQTASDLRDAGYKVTMYPAVLNPILDAASQWMQSNDPDASGATSAKLIANK